jgi:hypothetical protein
MSKSAYERCSEEKGMIECLAAGGIGDRARRIINLDQL